MNDTISRISKVLAQVRLLKDKYDDRRWFIWKYSEGGRGFPVEYPNPVVDDLFDVKKREEVVKELVSEIADAVRNLKEQLK